MKTGRTIFKNTVLLTAGKGLGDLCTFFFLIYFARVFGMDILGKYAFSMSVGGFLAIIVNLGLDTLMVREVSKDKALNHRYVANLLVTQGVLACIAWVLIGLTALSLDLSSDTKMIIVLVGTYHVFYKLTMLFRSEFKAHEEMQYSAFLEIYHKIVILILGVLAILIWRNPVITLAAYPFSAFTMFILGFLISVSRYGWPKARVEVAFIKHLLFKSSPFILLLVLSEFHSRIGIILLTLLKGEAAAGIYAAADRLLVTITAGVTTFGAAIFPVMSRLSVSSNRALLKFLDRAVRLMLVVVLPASTMLFISSEPVIITLYGDRYVDSVVVLSIRSWGLLFVGLNVVMSILLVATNQQKQWVKMQLGAVTVYGISCLLLIPQFGTLGLAYSKLGTGILLTFVTFYYVSTTMHKMNIFRMASGPVLSCGLTLVVYYIMADFSWWFSLPAVGIVLLAAMFLFRGVHFHDLVFVWNALLKTDRPAIEGQIGSDFIGHK